MSEIRSLLGNFRRLLDPRYMLSRRRIRDLKNKYKGQRAFIIGNGPSLNKMDLLPLRHEITFGLNRIYLLFERLAAPTTYYVVVNRLVIEQCAAEITSHVPGTKFIDWEARHLLPFTRNTIYLQSHHTEPRFFTDLTRGIWQGMTVTYVAMQIAYYLGFDQVILIGVDHSFNTQGPPHKVVLAQDKDPDHFSEDYFSKGFRWQLPDLDGSELAYRMAKYQYERAGRRILDATVGGKLQVFPKVDYAALFR